MLRRVEAYRDDAWRRVQLKDIKDRELFRLFEPDGSPVACKGKEVFTAQGDPYFLEDAQVWTIRIEGV